MSYFELPPPPRPPHLPEQIPQAAHPGNPPDSPSPEPVRPLEPERLTARPLAEQPVTPPQTTQSAKPSGPVSPAVVRAAIVRTYGEEAIAPVPREAQFGDEHILPPVFARGPVNRDVECSIQPVSFSPPPDATANRLVSGLARGVEVPPDINEPLRVRFIEARNINHPQMENELGLPDSTATAEDPDLFTGNYWVQDSQTDKARAALSLSYGANYDPDIAADLTTAITRGIGPSIMDRLPLSGANWLDLMVSVGDATTKFYEVREKDIVRFDVRTYGQPAPPANDADPHTHRDH